MAGVPNLQTIANFRGTTLVLTLLLSATIPACVHAADDDVLVSGVNEFEAGMSRDGSSTTTSDPAVSKIELQFNSPESRPFGALMRLKHEEDGNEVDEAYLRYRFGDENRFAMIAGKTYSPFGHFDSSLITDPMTLTLGESRSQGLKFELERGDWAVSAFASPVSASSGSDVASGAETKFQRGSDWQGYSLGLAAINNIAVSNGVLSALFSPGVSASAIPAVAAHATFASGNNRITVESVAATKQFATGDLVFAGNGAKPDAWRAEIARRFQIRNTPFTAAASWQQSHEALALDLPQSRIAAGLSAELSGNASLAVELMHDTAYPLPVGGNGKTNDTLTLQFALSF
jgi:hypothetical protein